LFVCTWSILCNRITKLLNFNLHYNQKFFIKKMNPILKRLCEQFCKTTKYDIFIIYGTHISTSFV
jgi:hypothetical protein